ncbi:Copper transporter 4 [Striga hermonthica]|uniref:Copper transport protein n=1 Tax=Striga hermonthica TaxID=68872 RepID=A0A9N7RMN0_STRHE|nr:Copper transporter 4 [Striga hermonthica]
MDLKSLPQQHNTFSGHPPPPPPGAGLAHHRAVFHWAFYWGKEAQFLFNHWPDNSSAMYALSLILVFTLAATVEFLSKLDIVKDGSNRVSSIFFRAGISAVRAGFAYMVVLAVMSYNGGVFIAAVLGHAVGNVAAFTSGLVKKDVRPN